MIKSKYSLLPLSEIATIYSGNSINKKVKQEKYTGLSQGRCFIATKDVDFDGTVCYENGVKIPYEEPSFKIAPPDCVFVCSEGGSAGKKTAYITQEVCFGNKLYAIIGKDDSFVGKYVYYYTRYRGFASQFKSLLNGIIGGVSLKKFGSILIPYPERSVQEQIVQHIEEQLSQLDSAVETLKNTKQRLEVYRQAVLKEAFANFKEFTTIRSVTSLVTSGSRGWAKYYSTSGAAFIRIGNLNRYDISISFDDLQCVKLPDHAEGVRSRLEPSDVLISITADLGSIGFVPYNIGEGYINQHIALVRFKNKKQSRFLAWYLRSDIGQKELLKNKRGAGKLGLGLDDIRDSLIPIVDDTTAIEVVSKIEEKLVLCSNIEETVNQSLQQAEALRQSVLKQAFEGN